MNRLSGAERREQDACRRDWLTQHPGLLKDLPSGAATMTVAQANALDRVYALMVHAGLYSRHSDRYAGRWAVRRLVSELRGLPIDKRFRHELRYV